MGSGEAALAKSDVIAYQSAIYDIAKWNVSENFLFFSHNNFCKPNCMLKRKKYKIYLKSRLLYPMKSLEYAICPASFMYSL